MSLDPATQKQLVIQFFQDVLSKQNYSLIPQLISDDYQFNGQPQSAASLQAWIDSLHAIMPGLNFLIEQILCEGDTVAVQWRLVAPELKVAPGKGSGFIRGTNLITQAGGKAISNNQNDLLGHNIFVFADGAQVPLPG